MPLTKDVRTETSLPLSGAIQHEPLGRPIGASYFSSARLVMALRELRAGPAGHGRPGGVLLNRDVLAPDRGSTHEDV